MWHTGFEAWWMGVMMIVFWGGIFALIAWTIRSTRTHPEPAGALGILESRYARGEIDDEEFRRRRATLGVD